MNSDQPPPRRLRILLYAQHLSGVGHFVRTSEIARALGRRHEVRLFDGGERVPRGGMSEVSLVPLPRIVRRARELAALDENEHIADVLRQRGHDLRRTVSAFRPDVLVIEHFPFSKWELRDEILGMICAARAAHPSTQVVCSVRDIPRQTRHEACSPAEYGSRVIAELQGHFDALMVHGDPALTRLEEHFPRAAEIGLPIEHTGIVSEPFLPSPEKTGAILRITQGASFVLASAGGGADKRSLLARCVGAWRHLQSRGLLRGWMLVPCAGPGWSRDALRELASGANGDSVVVRPFGTDFLHWMHAAALSVSCAGYNTCANVLETRCRALLAPDPEMSDQVFRADLMAAQGIAQVAGPAGLSTAALAQAILRSLDRPACRHTVALNGARMSCDFIERLAG